MLHGKELHVAVWLYSELKTITYGFKCQSVGPVRYGSPPGVAAVPAFLRSDIRLCHIGNVAFNASDLGMILHISIAFFVSSEILDLLKVIAESECLAETRNFASSFDTVQHAGHEYAFGSLFIYIYAVESYALTGQAGLHGYAVLFFND